VTERDWTVEVWLLAVRGEVDPEDARRHWNVKDAPVLDALLEEAPSLWIGTSEPPLPENEGLRGAAGRVIDLLSLYGTTPAYRLPALSEELEEELLAAYAPQPLDPVRFQVVDPAKFAGFLADHRGYLMTFRDRRLHRQP
jgi:hypothetical protein